MGNSRILSKFDLTEISKSISLNEIPSTANYQLNLTSVGDDEVETEYTLEVYPISQSWSEGTGQYFDTPISKVGSSWKYRDSKNVWGVSKTQIFNGSEVEVAPTTGVVLYEGFVNGSGSAFLTESINDFNGNSPFTLVCLLYTSPSPRDS